MKPLLIVLLISTVFTTGFTSELKLIEESNQVIVMLNDKAILTQVAKADFRPYIHPIIAPDGKGELTQYSPGHHKHQTGLYWGFTRVNKRDHFHNPGNGYFQRKSLKAIDKLGDKVSWEVVYELIDAKKQAVMTETKIWSFKVDADNYVLDLSWTGKAIQDVTIGKYAYGGLFLRMPWTGGIKAYAINSDDLKNKQAEGKRAKWVDVAMQVKGRRNLAHVVMMDHPDNPGYPSPWRIDNQLGVGPCYARLGDWTIPKGTSTTFKHRLFIYTGEQNKSLIEKSWADHTKKAKKK